jgi:PhnB protein
VARITAYLNFDGNCREAMTFYKNCFGGELRLQTVGETPQAGEVPGAKKDSIMHAELVGGTLSLMASDMMSDADLVRGNGTYLMLECDSEEEIKNLFAKLSAGAQKRTPLADQFWGAIYGDLTDKFGMTWMLNFYKPKA